MATQLGTEYPLKDERRRNACRRALRAPAYSLVGKPGFSSSQSAAAASFPLHKEGRPQKLSNKSRIPAGRPMHAFLLEDPDSAALVRFNVLGRAFVSLVEDLRAGGPWHIPGDRVAKLNRTLRGSAVIVAQRDGRLS